MTPYYSHGGITIYHGDCLELAAELPQCDALICDPPFFMPAQHYAARSEWARAWGDTAILASWNNTCRGPHPHYMGPIRCKVAGQHIGYVADHVNGKPLHACIRCHQWLPPETTHGEQNGTR